VSGCKHHIADVKNDLAYCELTKLDCEYLRPSIGRCFEEEGPVYQQNTALRSILMIEWDEMLKAPDFDGLLTHTFDDGYYSPVMQYIGLCDKKGQEIYEGDIDSDGFVFTFNTAMGGWYRMKNGEGFGWHSDCLTHGGTRLPFNIIGNIYESPELMGGDKANV